MRTLSTAVLALQFAAIPVAAQAQLANTTAYATAAVSVRARPDARAKSVARVAGESPVQVSGCDKRLVSNRGQRARRVSASAVPVATAQRFVQKRALQASRSRRAGASAHGFTIPGRNQ